MPLSTKEFAQARDIVGRALDQLGLKAYLYELEPADDTMKIRVECALDGEWEVVELGVDVDLLLRGMEDPGAQQSIQEQLRQAVSACLPPEE
jgi:hypothetical protein